MNPVESFDGAAHGGAAGGQAFALSLDPIAPDALADLILASALVGPAGVVHLRGRPERCSLVVTDGGVVVSELELPDDVGVATVARLALIAGLELPLPARTSAGVARVEARIGDATGEVLISMNAGATGFEVEIQPLGQPSRPSSPGVALKRCGRCGRYQPPQRAACDQDGAELADVEENPVVGGTIGTYRVRSVLGQGSTGTVFSVEHALIKKPVAIKVLHPSLANDAPVVARFLREARAASRVRHPSTLEVTDFGLLADARPFMVMERVAGVSLASRLASGGALPVRTALFVAREIASGLAAAHAAGVLHNDLKPSNVMLLETSTDDVPRLKLVDFGAASFAGEADEDDDDLLIGTPHYMAPERLLGHEADVRSDVYALGIVLFEMVSGSAPFVGSAGAPVILAQLRHAPPPAKSPFGPVPCALACLLKRTLAKNPKERVASMAALIADIDAILVTMDGHAGGAADA